MGQAERTRYPLYAMTTYELRDRRRELEQAIRTDASAGAVHEVLIKDLAAVLAEEDERASIRRGKGAVS
jgi:hypothetical protein